MKSLWVWPFELEEKIGEGGMGVVYRGRYIKNDRRVAVKLIPEDVADEIILARFEREVELLKGLRHPNIVHSFGGVCEDKRRFYAMELVDGGTLDELLTSRGGGLPWEQVIEFGVQMCAGLQYAHERGIIHRDVKPGNFLLTKAGKIKRSDFGLATVMAGNKLTASGKTVGSFRYMSPEQVRGKPDPVPQTDLYALGCVFFKMLAGRPPFEGATAAELLQKQLEQQPPRVTQFVPDCPLTLDRLIDAMLSKSIAERPVSAAEVSQTLQSVSQTTVVSIPSRKTLVEMTREMPTPSFASPADSEYGSQQKTFAKPSKFTLGLMITVFGLLGVCGYLYQSNRQLAKAEQLWIEAYRKSNEFQNFPQKAQAIKALGQLASHSSRALEALKEGLESKSPAVRAASLRALGDAGSAARPLAGKIFVRQRNDENSDVRFAAAEALKKIRAAEDRSFPWGFAFFLLLLGAGAVVSVFFWRRRFTSEA